MLSKAALYAFTMSTAAAAMSDPPRRSCGFKDPTTEEVLAIEKTNHARTAARKSRTGAINAQDTYVIKTYWHVIQQTDGTGALSQDVIATNMAHMNTHFGPAGFSFILEEVNQVTNDNWFNNFWADDSTIKPLLRRGTGADLNIYSTSISNNVLGYATFPFDYGDLYGPIDGVVNDYKTYIDSPYGFPPYNEGDTNIHEIGHWLGLYHTFQGGCGTQGDMVDDTPEVYQANNECEDIDSCPNDGQGPDLVNNFMDYTKDSCMDMFTTGQNDRMKAVYANFRENTDCYVNCEATPVAPPVALDLNTMLLTPDTHFGVRRHNAAWFSTERNDEAVVDVCSSTDYYNTYRKYGILKTVVVSPGIDTLNIQFTVNTNRKIVVSDALFEVHIIDKTTQATYPTVPIGSLFQNSDILKLDTASEWAAIFDTHFDYGSFVYPGSFRMNVKVPFDTYAIPAGQDYDVKLELKFKSPWDEGVQSSDCVLLAGVGTFPPGDYSM